MVTTHFERVKDGTIDFVKEGDLPKIPGYYVLVESGKIDVSLGNGEFYSANNQFEAEVIASLAELKEMIYDLAREVHRLRC